MIKRIARSFNVYERREKRRKKKKKKKKKGTCSEER